MKSFFVIISLVFSFSCHAIEPIPIQKNGHCPNSYQTNSGYCMPSRDSTFVIDKKGSCPSDYQTNGDYCVANNRNTSRIIEKSGHCPSGWSTVEKYCKEN